MNEVPSHAGAASTPNRAFCEDQGDGRRPHRSDGREGRADAAYRARARNIVPCSAWQLERFKRSYRPDRIIDYGRLAYAFCPPCQNVLRGQFLPAMVQRLELTARYEKLAQLFETSVIGPRRAWCGTARTDRR